MMATIYQHPTAPPPGSPPHSGGGPGDGLDARLRELEIQAARIEERVSSIQEHMAKKDDITNLKVWILVGVLSAIVIAAGIAATIVKAFF